MLKKIITTASLLFILTACQSNKKTANDCCRFHDDGRAKPTVAIAPLIDSTFYDIPWSLSEEFCELLNKKISIKGDIYIPEQENIKLSTEHNPFASDISWVKNVFKDVEFVTFIEITEHEDIAIKNHKKLPSIRKFASNLNISARLRIIDVRKEKPKIVLQEKISDVYFMPNTIERYDYNVAVWKTKEYEKTPMKKAHLQFTKQLSERIISYVKLAKSR